MESRATLSCRARQTHTEMAEGDGDSDNEEGGTFRRMNAEH